MQRCGNKSVAVIKSTVLVPGSPAVATVATGTYCWYKYWPARSNGTDQIRKVALA